MNIMRKDITALKDDVSIRHGLLEFAAEKIAVELNRRPDSFFDGIVAVDFDFSFHFKKKPYAKKK